MYKIDLLLSHVIFIQDILKLTNNFICNQFISSCPSHDILLVCVCVEGASDQEKKQTKKKTGWMCFYFISKKHQNCSSLFFWSYFHFDNSVSVLCMCVSFNVSQDLTREILCDKHSQFYFLQFSTLYLLCFLFLLIFFQQNVLIFWILISVFFYSLQILLLIVTRPYMKETWGLSW